MTKSFDEFNRDIESRSRYWTVDESLFAKEMYEAGQQSKQTEVDELQKRIDKAVEHIEDYYGVVGLSVIVDILKGDQS